MVFKSSRYVRKFTVLSFPPPEAPEAEFAELVRTYVDDNAIQRVIADHVGSQILANAMGAGLGSVPRFSGMPTADLNLFNDK